MSRKTIILAACLVAASTGSSLAADDRGICGANPPKSETITSCTRVIASPATSAHDRALALTFRAGAMHASGDTVRAVNDYSEALTLLPDFGPALVGRGIAYSEANDLPHALADFDQAVKINPRDAKALYERGMTKRKNGDAAAGDADIAAAKAINPNIDRP